MSSSSALAGNVDSAGTVDALIGAPGADPDGRMDAGEVTLFLGGTEFPGITVIYRGESPGDRAGVSVPVAFQPPP